MLDATLYIKYFLNTLHVIILLFSTNVGMHVAYYRLSEPNEKTGYRLLLAKKFFSRALLSSIMIPISSLVLG